MKKVIGTILIILGFIIIVSLIWISGAIYMYHGVDTMDIISTVFYMAVAITMIITGKYLRHKREKHETEIN